MQAFLNDGTIKAKYLARVKAHQKADEIIKGKYWQDGKGCAVGCTVHSDSHNAYETELGIPRAVARIEDVIFEGLPNGQAMEWPLRFLDAVEVGSDLSMVWPKFTLWVLQGVLQYAKPKGKLAIQTVILLFQEWVNGSKPSQERFLEAKRAAYADADAYAAYAAAYAAAAAAYADADADDAAAAARKKFWVNASDKLIELIKECE